MSEAEDGVETFFRAKIRDFFQDSGNIIAVRCARSKCAGFE